MSEKHDGSDVIGVAKVVGVVDSSSANSLAQIIGGMNLNDNDRSELLVAATTMQKMMAGIFGEDNLLPNSWSSCGAETFSMRIGPNYNKHKQKGPSATALYEFAGVE